MIERSRLTRSHFDCPRAAFGIPQITAAQSVCRAADILRTTVAPELSFLVARHTEPINPSASISADRLVVVPSGYVDMDTAPVLGAALANAVDSHPEVCCDLAAVGFFSAAGIRVLVMAHDRAGRSGSRFSIRGASGITHRVLRITQVDRLLANPTQHPGGRRQTTI
jgi:anti-anti-sigma factor